MPARTHARNHAQARTHARTPCWHVERSLGCGPGRGPGRWPTSSCDGAVWRPLRARARRGRPASPPRISRGAALQRRGARPGRARTLRLPQGGRRRPGPLPAPETVGCSSQNYGRSRPPDAPDCPARGHARSGAANEGGCATGGLSGGPRMLVGRWQRPLHYVAGSFHYCCILGRAAVYFDGRCHWMAVSCGVGIEVLFPSANSVFLLVGLYTSFPKLPYFLDGSVGAESWILGYH